MTSPPDTTFPIDETFGQMIDRQLPNLFRLYLNPIVVQACLCLSRIAGGSRCETTDRESFHVFLANGHDEALSGAIKLARYVQHLRGGDGRALVCGRRARIAHFASTVLPCGRRIQFLPDVVECFEENMMDVPAVDPRGFGIVVSFASSIGQSDQHKDGQLTILSVASGDVFDSDGALQRGWSPIASPDIIVFDESWVHRKVPFSAFAARSSLFQHWRKKNMAMFHSTTFQPNTIASLQLLNCLRGDAEAFMEAMSPLLERVERDHAYRSEAFRSLYSPSLERLIRTTGFDQSEPIAEGHKIRFGKRTVFDAVGGVACSIRGHNPPSYLREIAGMDGPDLPGQLDSYFQKLIGLGHCTPAGSGAAAVEAALKIGLATQTRGDYVLALRGGFGGKTLLALAGTDNDRLKKNLWPLYPNVIFVDPYAADCIDALQHAMDHYPIGVVQMELVQGVGGVRAVPRSVIDYVQQRRESDQYWLFVDEVQTGMYRTGEITLSKRIGVNADILTLGKGTSDMMFPSALTLHSEEVERRLRETGTDLDAVLKQRHEYEWGYKTILNALQFCERQRVREKVIASERLFRERLHGEVARLPNVREIRVFGLLIGIELQVRGPLARFGSSLASLYLLEMLHHPRFPLMAGFCQNERNVLKLTPPLTVDAEEIADICDTVTDALARPLSRLAMSGASAKLRCHLPSHGLKDWGNPAHNASVAAKSRAHESTI